MQSIDINLIPQLDVEMAPHDPGANESGVHHPVLIFLALLAAGAVG